MIHEKETYQFLFYKFYVKKLYDYALANLELVDVDLQQIADGYNFDLPKDKISMFRLDKEYAMQLSEDDLSQPIIILYFGAGYGSLMVDGTHRSYNLWKKGNKTIKAYYITDEKAII